jgi:hypothetical protein
MSATTNIYFNSADDFLAHGLNPFAPRNKAEECPICQESWADDPTEAVTTPCNHHFHKDCITHWITRGRGKHASCPLCRTDFFTEPTPEDDWEVAEEQDFPLNDDDDDDDDDDYEIEEDEATRQARLERESVAAELIRERQDTIFEVVRTFWEIKGQRREDDETWKSIVVDTICALQDNIGDRDFWAACKDAAFHTVFTIIEGYFFSEDISERDREELEDLVEELRDGWVEQMPRDDSQATVPF